MIKTKTDTLKFIMAILVFFCHVFQNLNFFGCFFVSIFFFLSGYGTKESSKTWTKRIIDLMPLYLIMVLLYSLFAGEFYWKIPSAWFLLVYAIQHIIYGISKSIKESIFFDILLLIFFYILDFSFVWYASMFCFPFGIYSRSKNLKPLKSLDFITLMGFSIIIFLFSCFFKIPLQPISCILFCMAVVPFSVYLPCLRTELSAILFPFYLVHILFLDIFGVRPDLGYPANLPLPLAVAASLLLSFITSLLVNKFLQKASFLKKKCDNQ